MMKNPSESPRAKILVIDDEPANTLLLERLLLRDGNLDVLAINDPAQALLASHSFEPDLILLDLLMPGIIDGYQLLHSFRVGRVLSRPIVPVIVLTADASHAAKVRALEEGASDFLTKPLDTAEVLLRIRNQLATRHAHVELNDRRLVLSGLVSERTQELEQAHRALLGTLASAAEVRDDATGKHVQRVGESAFALAQGLGLPADQARMIGDAAPLHDLGKIAIPDAVLLKPARLTKEEFDVIKTHPEVGASMLAGEDMPLMRAARSIALTHHERWDGGGYPRGLRGLEIPIAGRIVSVVDVYDALIHERPYKEAWPVDRALEELVRGRGTQFDGDVVDAFIGSTADASVSPPKFALPEALPVAV